MLSLQKPCNELILLDLRGCKAQSFTQDTMASADAAQRVRERIQAWVKREGRGSLKQLAEAVPGAFGQKRDHQAWATGIHNGSQDLRLKDLDDVAELLGVPPGELVRAYDRNYLELTMAETRLVEYFRCLPDTVRQHWLYFLDFVFLPRLTELKTSGREAQRRTDAARKRESVKARRQPAAEEQHT